MTNDGEHLCMCFLVSRASFRGKRLAAALAHLCDQILRGSDRNCVKARFPQCQMGDTVACSHETVANSPNFSNKGYVTQTGTAGHYTRAEVSGHERPSAHLSAHSPSLPKEWQLLLIIILSTMCSWKKLNVKIQRQT